MTPNDVELVQSSFRKILPLADQAAALFYARLFELEPGLRACFPGDIDEQTRKLVSIVTAAVSSLQRLDRLGPTIRTLGAQNGSFGGGEDHFESVGAALRWTLQKGLGPEFTPAVCAAWTNTYSVVAKLMLEMPRTPEAQGSHHTLAYADCR